MSFGTRFQYTKVNSEEPNEQELREVTISLEVTGTQNVDANPSAPEMSQGSQTTVTTVTTTPTQTPEQAPEILDYTAPPPPIVPSSSSTSSNATTQTAPSASLSTQNEAVFANNIASECPPKYEDDVLPSYNESLDGSSPFSRFGVTLSSEGQDAFEGRRVGSGWVFFFSTLMSWFFGILGFACVYMMSQTHAGKLGARAGLGLMGIQFGFYIRKYYYLTEGLFNEEGSNSQDSQTTDNTQISSEAEEFSQWLAYLFMFIGWFIFIRAVLQFVRVRQLARMNN